MIYPLMILLLGAIAILIGIGYRRPKFLNTDACVFTRRCLAAAILAYGTSLILLQCVPMEIDVLGFAILAEIPGWILLTLVFRGIFEVLSEFQTTSAEGEPEASGSDRSTI